MNTLRPFGILINATQQPNLNSSFDVIFTLLLMSHWLLVPVLFDCYPVSRLLDCVLVLAQKAPGSRSQDNNTTVLTWRGYLHIFCTGVSKNPSRGMSIIFCCSLHASRKRAYFLLPTRDDSSLIAVGWLLQYSEYLLNSSFCDESEID